MNENKIRDSKNVIPETSEYLKEDIFEEFKKRSTNKSYSKPVYNRKRLFITTLSCILLALVISVIIPMSTVTGYNSSTTPAVIGTEDGLPEASSSPRSPGKILDGSKGGSSFFSGMSGAPSGYGGESAPTESAPKDDTSYDSNSIYRKTLTSSCVNDNDEFAYWNKLNTFLEDQKEGKFKSFYEEFAFKTLNRIKITLPKGVSGTVSLLNNNIVTFKAVPDKNGICYLFSDVKLDTYNIEIEYKTSSTATKKINDVVTGDKDYSSVITDGFDDHKDLIEIAVVIDTTGSMGDEITFLQKELVGVINEVKENNPNVEIKVSVIAYKDECDAQEEYLTKKKDFTNNLTEINEFLSNIYASGGGDFEEAVEVALKDATELSWSSEDSTKLCLFVADAPSHDEKVSLWAKSVSILASKGVRIINVASSGISSKTEYFFRSQAIITGGIYGYLTDDSGIGGEHLIASTEEPKTVEYLTDMLVRLINGYYTGTFSNPIAYSNNNQE